MFENAIRLSSPQIFVIKSATKSHQVDDDENDKNETGITREDNAYSDLNNKTVNWNIQ